MTSDVVIHSVCMNGAAILDPRDQVLWQAEIDKEILAEMIDTFPDVPLEFNTIDEIYCTVDQDAITAAFQRKNAGRERHGFSPSPIQPRMIMDHRHVLQSKEQILAQPILKINCVQDDSEGSRRLRAYLEEKKDVLVSAPSYDWLFEITSADVSKARAVKRLGEILGITPQETAVYGDGGNDLEMLKAFEHSYASADSSPEAKQAAAAVLGPSADHSVIRHMVRTCQEEGKNDE